MSIDEILALQDFKQALDILTKDTKEPCPGKNISEYSKMKEVGDSEV